jgi:hypothetical protein
MEAVMRQKRNLAENVWYQVSTAINNREPVFQLLEAVALFYRVLVEAKVRFPFEGRLDRLRSSKSHNTIA